MSKIDRLLVPYLGSILLTPLLLTMFWVGHPTYEIGIVLIDDTDDHFANEIIKGYQGQDDYFQARVLPLRFNASQVRVQLPFELYLNSNIIERSRPLELARTHKVDIILLITDHRISDWEGDNDSIWGEAFPEHRAVLTSTAFLSANDTLDNRAARQIALHETLHLLGYTHNTFYQDGIMGYGEYREERHLLPFEQLQLPLRATLASWWGPSSFTSLVAITRLTFALVLMPPFLVCEHYHYSSTKKRQRQANHHSTVAAAVILLSLALLVLLNESFLVLLFPPLLSRYGHRSYERYQEKHKKTK